MFFSSLFVTVYCCVSLLLAYPRDLISSPLSYMMVDMQVIKIADPSEPPSHIPAFSWEVGL